MSSTTSGYPPTTVILVAEDFYPHNTEHGTQNTEHGTQNTERTQTLQTLQTKNI